MRFPWGNTISQTQANYNSDASDSYDNSSTRGNHPLYFKVGERTCINTVKAFAANVYGLYGVTGNSWEWCWDWFGDYGAGAQVDPIGPPNGSTRVARGGSFYNSGR
jgi:formylglycine-generating enzyme required for sulfatase activity